MKPPLLLLLLALAGSATRAADRLGVTVTHELEIARPAETIAVPWAEIARALPGAMVYHLAVHDAAGHSLACQVTNLRPEAKDPKQTGGAYGELLFQHDFAAGEKSAAFTIERVEEDVPPFPAKALARFVPERLDDFAWENDRIGHRTYGPALGAPDDAHRGKEVLVTSGIDIWCKRVAYPVVDRWYNKGHDYYHHHDLTEGMDMYNVGPSRGCGGTGLWDGKKLAVSRNYRTWRILANGPVRAVFELTYDPWEAGGIKVAETKRFTVDAGHNLDEIASTFTVVEGSAPEITVGIGLNKTPADKGQEPKTELARSAARGSLTQWIVQKSNGSLGTAIAVPSEAFADFAEDDRNHLILARVPPGQPLRYLAGAGWDRSGQFSSRAEWEDYVAAAAARFRSPVTVTVEKLQP